jgi:hypothetical protein
MLSRFSPILAEMQQASHKGYISPYYLAVVYSGIGRMDEAFRLPQSSARTADSLAGLFHAV